ncbi:SHOCT domain-containing protein [Bacillus sp. J33]|uniref:SHOCT domain-containing protein n=1 Tax=Bacillus sp. J33 TaxID=935836 RepID=UPI0004BB3A26|nr:SHOCT domain-containing protein [Bacillus sp. J33]
MSFFKKLLGQEDLSPEEKERREKQALERKAQKEKEYQAWKDQREREKAIKKAEKEKQKELELEKVKKFFGPNPGFTAKTNFAIYKKTFEYLENNILTPDEKVLATIPAEYDKNKKTEIKGVLVATDQKLIFGTITINREHFESFDYKKMVGISLANDGLLSKELHINFSRGKKVFDDIVNDDNFKHFLEQVRKQIASSKNQGKTPSSKVSSPKTEDKYKQLEQLGSLKEKGIITEEEFQAEKQKLLNS